MKDRISSGYRPNELTQPHPEPTRMPGPQPPTGIIWKMLYPQQTRPYRLRVNSNWSKNNQGLPWLVTDENDVVMEYRSVRFLGTPAAIATSQKDQYSCANVNHNIAYIEADALLVEE